MKMKSLELTKPRFLLVITVIEGDINGQSKHIGRKGEDDSWSPVGENETLKCFNLHLENIRLNGQAISHLLS